MTAPSDEAGYWGYLREAAEVALRDPRPVRSAEASAAHMARVRHGLHVSILIRKIDISREHVDFNDMKFWRP